MVVYNCNPSTQEAKPSKYTAIVFTASLRYPECQANKVIICGFD